MRQIFTLILFVFIFFGCTPKQVVELKLPNKNKIEKVVKPAVQKDEDSVTVVEEFVPIDIKESDAKEPKETISPSSAVPSNSSELMADSQSIDSEEPIAQNISNIQIDADKAKIQVAFIYPSTLVSKYAKGSLNTISGYFSYQKAQYNLLVIDCVNESYDSIDSAFSKVKEQGITNVIALLTPNSLNSLNKVVSNDFKVYLPLIEKKDSLENNDNLIFGSISYEQQLKKLSDYSIGNNAMFYQESYLGNKLRKSYDLLIPNTTVKKEIKKNETNFKNIVADYRLNNSSLFLNTDVVKSALILSQLRAYDIYPKIIFSTQLNYDPMLMSLTQEKDREKLVVANSIDNVNSKLKDEISNFGGNIVYEWVDYSTLVGINYLYKNGNSSLILTQIIDKEAVYSPKLFKSTEFGFLEIK